eukprot:scaffold175030_cov16-Tisochrysis_lutea.AAC.1
MNACCKLLGAALVPENISTLSSLQQENKSQGCMKMQLTKKGLKEHAAPGYWRSVLQMVHVGAPCTALNRAKPSEI